MSITSRGIRDGNIITDENYGCVVTEHSTIFKRGRNVTSAFVKIELHRKMEDYLHFDDTVIAANLNSRILIGIGKDMFEHDINEKSWRSVQNYKNAYCERTHAEACEIYGAVLVCGGTNKPSSVELIAYKRHDSCKGDRNIISDHSHEPHEACFDLLQPQAYCDTPLPIPLFFGHTVTRIGKGTVLAIGGAKELVDDNGWGNAWDGDDELAGTESNRTFIGTLNETQDDLIWKELNSMKHGRLNHVAFKMKQSVYVIGGSSSQECERFDLKEMRWFGVHHMPPSFCCSPYSAMVDENESYAILLCDHYFTPVTSGGNKCSQLDINSRKINIFSEKNGFQTLTIECIANTNFDSLKCKQRFFRHFATTTLT